MSNEPKPAQNSNLPPDHPDYKPAPITLPNGTQFTPLNEWQRARNRALGEYLARRAGVEFDAKGAAADK